MPVTNINNDHFTQAQKDQVNGLVTQILTTLNTKTRNLTPEERQAWGSINEQNKLATLKSMEYGTNAPNLRSPNVDYTEMSADWSDRMFLAGVIARFMEGIRIADNIRITHDWDAHQATKQDYRHAEYMTQTDGGAGWEEKYEALKQFFTTNPNGNPGNDNEGDQPNG